MPTGAAGNGSRLEHYVRSYDDGLPAQLCGQLVATFEAMQAEQRRNGRGIRAGLEHSAWTELDLGRHMDGAFIQFFREQISHSLQRYNRDITLPVAVPDSPSLSPLILKRYRASEGECFQTHFDSINEVCDRYLVFLWYLNDVVDGGETWFPGLGLGVSPRAGRLLMFPPFWLYAHQGRPSPTTDKYILSTYLRFPRAR